MPARKIWLASLIAHAGFWLISLSLSLAYLFLTDDAWYAMARRHFIGTFLLIQLSMLPHYLIIGTLVFLWGWALLELWRRWKPQDAWRRRFAILVAWFWLTAYSVSIFGSFSSWFIVFNFLREQTGIDINYGTLSFLSIPVWANAIVFAIVGLGASGWGLYRVRGKRLYAAAGAAALIGVGWIIWPTSAVIDSTGTPNPAAPNIVIVGSDSMRADHLGCYGYSRDTCPTIDAIARQGALCERMYVATPSTQESLLAMLSGRTPQGTGVRCIFPSRQAVLASKKFPQVTESLRRAGYRTVVTGDWAASDFEHVMEGFDDRDVEPSMKFVDYMDSVTRRCHPFLLAFFMTPATSWAAPELMTFLKSSRTHESVLARAEAEIETAARTKRPLFLFVFVSTTHLPYHVPEGTPLVFGDPDYRGRHHRQVDISLHELVHGDLATSLYPERQRVEDLYDSCIRAFDGQVARVAKALEANGIAKNTLLIILSDHGDDHWDPGTGLGRTVANGDQSIRIPFILRWPDRLAPRRIPQLLRATDVASTLAELMRVPWEGPGSFLKHLDGAAVEDDREALVEAGVGGAGPVTYPPSGEHLSYPAMTELVVPDLTWETRLVVPPEGLSVAMKAKDRVLIRGKWKLVYQPMKRGPQVQMFDLSADPHCRSPLPPDPAMLSRLREIIVADPEEYYLAWPREIFDQAMGR